MITGDEMQMIQKSFDTYYLNLKAEVLIAELLENTNLSEEDIVIIFDSTFSRGFRRDIISSKININEKFQINVSRNGIYDALPQGVFHQNVGLDTHMSYAQIRQKNKQEEAAARMLFAPIENELFLHRMFIEQAEKNIIFELNNRSENSYSLNFWNIQDKVPKEYLYAMMKALPFAYKISKHEDLIQQCLASVIDEKVTIIKDFKPLTNLVEDFSAAMVLGVDSALAIHQSRVLFPFYDIFIEIKNLNNKDRFLKNGIGNQLISVFCEYFVPLEIEHEVHITYAQSKKFSTLDEDSSILGLSATL